MFFSQARKSVARRRMRRHHDGGNWRGLAVGLLAQGLEHSAGPRDMVKIRRETREDSRNCGHRVPRAASGARRVPVARFCQEFPKFRRRIELCCEGKLTLTWRGAFRASCEPRRSMSAKNRRATLRSELMSGTTECGRKKSRQVLLESNAASTESLNAGAPAATPRVGEAQALLYAKGSATAVGFRPWHWSYESTSPPVDAPPPAAAPIPSPVAVTSPSKPAPARRRNGTRPPPRHRVSRRRISTIPATPPRLP